MSWTKLQLVEKAFGELALAGYVFDISPEEQQDATERLEAMLAFWESDGIRIGYAFASNPADADPDTESGIPQSAARTVYSGLAIDIASSYGKQLTSATRRNFAEGYGRLLRVAAFPQEQQLPSTLPRGAGNSISRSEQPFFPSPDTGPLGITQGGDLDILSE